jgi:anti-sigma factor RsiW
MNHPTEDELLLLAYGELGAMGATELEAHLKGCAACRGQLTRMEQARVAADWTYENPKRRVVPWVWALLATAAVLAGILVINRPMPHVVLEGWPRHQEWSATAGYIAGGRAAIDIDAQLTQLEQGWSYGRP